jgi:hypothetical protein
VPERVTIAAHSSPSGPTSVDFAPAAGYRNLLVGVVRPLLRDEEVTSGDTLNGA